MSVLKCSVVIPTYNRVTLLRHTLESLTRQSLPRDQFEVLVIDDGSSDTTADMVNGYRERLDLRYFFQPDEGWRVAKARNAGISEAAADVCVLIDSGVILHSGCLAAHVTSHESADSDVAVCGYVYCFNIDNDDADRINQVIDFDDPDATIEMMTARRQWLDIREEFYERYTDDFSDVPAPWVMFWTCNVSVRTARLRSVGAFDEAFQAWGGEDLDLAYRLHRDGARFIVNRQASSIHCPHYKKFEENDRGAAINYQYMAEKYDTPIARLLRYSPEIHPFNINDVIMERGLPRCADYQARQRVA
jgi:glycosyltransferase involved in cell wall biosynthesis